VTTNLATVFTTNQAAEAEILKSMLETEGIRCQLDGAHQAGFTGVLDIRGLVPAEDEARARELLGPHSHLRDAVPTHPAKEHTGHPHPQVGVAHAVTSRQSYRDKSDHS
jgi:hypothetical protein